MVNLTMQVTGMHADPDQLIIPEVQWVAPISTMSLYVQACTEVFSPVGWLDTFMEPKESGAPILSLLHLYICGMHSNGDREPRCNICVHLLSQLVSAIRNSCLWPPWYPPIKPTKRLVTRAGLTAHAPKTSRYFLPTSKRDVQHPRSAERDSIVSIVRNGSIHVMAYGWMQTKVSWYHPKSVSFNCRISLAIQ